MWINDEVDLPQALIIAQREGRLVVFAGAGVSIGAPSNLPSFEDLATAVAQAVLPRKAGEPLDAFLGRVEQHGVDIQIRTRNIIDVSTSTSRDLHHSIAKLFRNAGSFRLVTTNFDRHFTTVSKAKYPGIDTFIGPALPLGREFEGIVYLHGAVENPRSHLVLTDGDFGRAYLADGWATRFLMEMFRTYAVLFIGYSHQDPVMRYLARSFVGGTERYSLTPAGQDDFWSNLGITPVHFPLRDGAARYGAIDAALEDWSKRASMGAFDHKARITQLAEGLPPVDPESVDCLRSAVADSATLKFFIETAGRIEWLRWIEDQGFFAPLVATAEITSDEPRLLAAWLADRYAINHAAEALEFVQRHAATVNAELTRYVAFRLGLRTQVVPEDKLRIWTTALLALNSTTDDSLTRLLSKSAETGVIDAAALLFRSLLRPRLEFERPWSGPDFGGPLTLSAQIALGGDHYQLRRAWEEILKQHIEALHRDFLPMVGDYLNSAWTLLQVAGRVTDDWDPMSFRRSAIEPHEQNQAEPEWGLLVDVARDVLTWTVEHRPALAQATIEAWIAARPRLLNRLAIHATAKRTDVGADDALALIEQHGWLYASSLKHETFLLLERAFPTASDQAQRRFIAYSMAKTVVENEATDADAKRTANYERYNLAVWLHRIAPGSAAASERFDLLQKENPGFGPRDHPDMDRWISAGFGEPRSPITSEEFLTKQPAEAATYVLEYEPEGAGFDHPDRHGLLAMFEKAAAQNIEWSMALANELVTRDEWNGDVWSSLFAAWRNATLDSGQWRAIVAMLDQHFEIVESTSMRIANFLDQGVRRSDLQLADIDTLERIGERVLAQSASEPADDEGARDWLTAAINHPAGEVALMWLRALAYRKEEAGDTWDGLPNLQRDRFEALLGGQGKNAVMARVALASQAHFLFHADRSWTEAHILPLFDWSADSERAKQAWDGFLTWGQWNEALFKQMAPFVRQTLDHLNELDDAEAFVTRLAAVSALSPHDPWHNGEWLVDAIRMVETKHRARWAEQVCRYAESLTAEGADALWNRWVRAYWDDRITGVPQPLDEGERQAMVCWILPFRAHSPEVVARIVAALPQRIDHFTFYRLDQSGLATSHAAEMGRLLRAVLHSVEGVDYDTGELLSLATSAFEGGAAREDLLVVADDMARLGIAGADQLRAMIDGGT